MVQICNEEGVLSIVDAAHSVGQEMGIDLGAVRPDFWISVRLSRWLHYYMTASVEPCDPVIPELS